jgi:hypothetical protein
MVKMDCLESCSPFQHGIYGEVHLYFYVRSTNVADLETTYCVTWGGKTNAFILWNA